MDVPALRRILIDLIGTARRPALEGLTASDWQRIDEMAAQHRLQPLLHAHWQHDPALPVEIAQRWRAAHRSAAMIAMVQQAELAETGQVLARAGFTALSLKGAWLSARAYPEAAQRPMRDLDLLVPGAQVLEAYAALQAAGYCTDGPTEMALADCLRLDKHLPPLIAPRGTVIELHHKLWEHDGRLDHASPSTDEAAVLARGLPAGEGLAWPSPGDLLAHLIIHAVYSHRLDCGPLLLPDIDLLLRAAPIDWASFWERARIEGWREGARLVLDLVALHRPGARIDFGGDAGGPTPAPLLDSAPDLLLQDLDTRTSAGLAAATLKAGPGRLLARMRGRRGVVGEADAVRDMAAEGGRLAWATSRVWRSLRDLARADVRRQSRQLAALSSWLDSGLR